MTRKQVHLAAHFPGVNNTTVWSDPRSGSQIDFDSFTHLARTAERGRFDFFFLAEGLRLRELKGRIYDLDADVVVAPDDATARRLAAPYGLWVRSIRRELRAIRFPTPDEAAGHAWTDADRALVADRIDTQFVGSPRTVAERLRTLRRVTGADELQVTTITHDHADRVRSFQLLAEEWNA